MADTAAAPKGPHPGERLASYFENFFKTIAGIATLGASITFSKIVQSPVPPFQDFHYDKIAVQWFLAVSWLFFVLALAFTSFFASLLSLFRPQAVEYFGTKSTHKRRTVMWYATGASALLYGLSIVAFVFTSLVVVAYAGPVGWVAVSASVAFGLFGFCFILAQSPLFMQDEESRGRRSQAADPIRAHMKLHGMWDEKPVSGGWNTTPSRKSNPYWQKDGTSVQGTYTDRYTARSATDPRRYDDKRYSRASTTVSGKWDESPVRGKSNAGDDVYESDLWGKDGAVFQTRYKG